MDEEVIRRERILALARADRAEALLREVELARDVDAGTLTWRAAEIARLQRVVSAQGEEIARLRQRTAELEALVAQATLAELLEGVAGAVGAAGAALGPEQALVGGSAELRVSLVPGAQGRLAVTGPALTDPRALSSVRVDMSALLPTPEREAALGATEDLRQALGDLQAALAGDLPASLRAPADRALAVVALAAGPELTPETAAERMESVLVAMGPLARRRKGLAAAVAAARRALAAAHEPEGQVALAAAVRLVVARLER
jgi:hypothetical protein